MGLGGRYGLSRGGGCGVCRGAGLNSAAGVCGPGVKWGKEEKTTVFLACPVVSAAPEDRGNVSQPQIQFGSKMRTVTWNSGRQLSRV